MSCRSCRPSAALLPNISAARARYQTERSIHSLPIELQKDIGWPDAYETRNAHRFVASARERSEVIVKCDTDGLPDRFPDHPAGVLFCTRMRAAMRAAHDAYEQGA